MKFILTSDVDFVSDDILEFAYRSINKLPLTIFLTGKSDYLKTMAKSNKRWELEVHPNFCNGSTHGKAFCEVVRTIEKFSGEKIGYRCHRYYSSNDVDEYFSSIGYKYSSNICTDLVEMQPFKKRNGTIEIPIFFEDGGYLKYHGVPLIDNFINNLNNKNGVYVFNFHPIHLALNSSDFDFVYSFKNSMDSKKYNNMKIEEVLQYRNTGYGMADFFNELIKYAKENNIEFINLREYYEECKGNRF